MDRAVVGRCPAPDRQPVDVQSPERKAAILRQTRPWSPKAPRPAKRQRRGCSLPRPHHSAILWRRGRASTAEPPLSRGQACLVSQQLARSVCTVCSCNWLSGLGVGGSLTGALARVRFHSNLRSEPWLNRPRAGATISSQKASFCVFVNHTPRARARGGTRASCIPLAAVRQQAYRQAITGQAQALSQLDNQESKGAQHRLQRAESVPLASVVHSPAASVFQP